MISIKDKLINLIETLSDKQIEYIYHLVRNLFGHTVD